MQIAPDGNIYVGFHKEEFLSVIENPDSSLPECKFRYQSLCLNGAFFANMFQHIPRFLPTFRYTCSCGSVDFHYSGFPTETLLWNFGDGSSSSQESPSHIYEIPGTYEATLHVFFQENQIKTIKRQITIKKPSAPRIIPE